MDELISRQAAIDGRIIIQRTNGVEIYSDEAVPVGYLKNLPSAQSKRGKWIWNGDTLDWERLHYCSECKKYALRDTDGKYEVLSDFCPNCGADMRGEKNDDFKGGY